MLIKLYNDNTIEKIETDYDFEEDESEYDGRDDFTIIEEEYIKYMPKELSEFMIFIFEHYDKYNRKFDLYPHEILLWCKENFCKYE